MNLPTEILSFFARDIDGVSIQNQPKTIGDFVYQPQYLETLNILEVFRIINKFKVEGYLISAGYDLKVGTNPMTQEMLISFNYDAEVAKYGTYDYLIYGFESVAKNFQESVRPIIVTKENGDIDIGTGFLLGNSHTLVTARHVVENTTLIQIPDKNGKNIQAVEITLPEDENIDIAIILVSNYAFFGIQPFNAKEALILENVMTIGYPPIPGFDAMQVYETSSINNRFKFSKGQIIGRETAYIDSIEYLLMNAKVKGGNSGSPVINTKGNVVGMVVQIPIDSNDSTKLDSLGYGIITPRSEIIKLLESDTNIPKIKKLQVENTQHGFRIIK